MMNTILQKASREEFDEFARQVEAELMRHGFPSYEVGSERDLWLGIPNEVVLAEVGTSPLDCAREVMWWHDGTVLRLAED